MAAEYSANAEQLVLPGQSVIFNENPVPCSNGYIFHRDGTGSFLLASRANRQTIGCGCCGTRFLETQYEVEFHANIAVPTGGTVGPIDLAVAIDGIIDQSSLMEITPAAVDEYGNVSAGVIVSVPSVCRCSNVSIVNAGTEPAGINVRNANIIFHSIGVRVAA